MNVTFNESLPFAHQPSTTFWTYLSFKSIIFPLAFLFVLHHLKSSVILKRIKGIWWLLEGGFLKGGSNFGEVKRSSRKKAVGAGRGCEQNRDMPKAYWQRNHVKAEGWYLRIGGNLCRFLIRERYDKSGFRKISLSPGKMGAKNIAQVCHSEGIPVGRGRHSHKNIYSTPWDKLSKQCVMASLSEEICLLKISLF